MPKSLFTDAHGQFVRVLIAARAEAGLTQVQLAGRLGKPQSFVSKYERGERRLDVIEFIAIADAMDVEPSKLLQLFAKGLERPLSI